MDNSQPIPEPILSKVKKYLEDNPNISLLEAAQYGYNIAQVFVKELELLLQKK